MFPTPLINSDTAQQKNNDTIQQTNNANIKGAQIKVTRSDQYNTAMSKILQLTKHELEVSIFRKKLNEFSNKRNELLETPNHMDATIERLLSDVEMLEVHIKSTISAKKDALVRLDRFKLRTETERLQAIKIDSLSKQLSLYRDGVQKMRSKNEILKQALSKVDKLVKDNQQLRSDYQKSKKQLREFQCQESAKKATIVSLTGENDKLKSEIHSVNSTLKCQVDEIICLKCTILRQEDSMKATEIQLPVENTQLNATRNKGTRKRPRDSYSTTDVEESVLRNVSPTGIDCVTIFPSQSHNIAYEHEIPNFAIEVEVGENSEESYQSEWMMYQPLPSDYQIDDVIAAALQDDIK